MTGSPRSPGHRLAGWIIRFVQLGLAVWLFGLAPLAERPWTFYVYYGSLVVAIPAAVDRVSGGKLTPLRRLYVSAGLALHPLSFFYRIYPTIWWWDSLAHFVSASLLAGAAYGVLLALRSGRETGAGSNPGWRVHGVAFLVVLVGGASWEVYETLETYLTVYGPVDTAKDLVVDVAAWVVVSKVHPWLLGDIPRGVARQVPFLQSGDGRQSGTDPESGGGPGDRDRSDGGPGRRDSRYRRTDREGSVRDTVVRS